MLTNIVLQVENRPGKRKDTKRVNLSDRKGWKETIDELTGDGFPIKKTTRFKFHVVDLVCEGLTVYSEIKRRNTRIDFAKSFYEDLVRFNLLNSADPGHSRKLEMFLAASQCVSVERLFSSFTPSDWTSKIDFVEMSLDAYSRATEVPVEELEAEGYKTVFVDGKVCVCKVYI